MNLFSLDFGLALWTWVTFGLLCLILAKLVLPRVLHSLEQREALITRSVDDALTLEVRLKDIAVERQVILNQARQEGDALIHEARKQADQVRRTLLEQTAHEVETLLAQGRARVTEERRTALEGLSDELAEFGLLCAASIVGESMNGEKQRQWARDKARQL